MKSFFLKVSLLAGLSLSGFCSVFAQSKKDVVNTYLKVVSKSDLINHGVYVVAAPIKDTTLIAVMAGPDKAKSPTYRHYINISSDSLRSDMLYLNTNLISIDTKNPTSYAFELFLHEKSLTNKIPVFYLFDSLYNKYLEAKNSDKKDGSNLCLSATKYNKCEVALLFNEQPHQIDFNPNESDTYDKKMKKLKLSSNRFSCYNKNGGIEFAQLYRKVIPIKMTSAGYSTLCADYAFKMPEGLTGGIVKSDDGIKLTIDYCYPTDSIVPAHTPIILKGAENTYNASVMSVDGNTYEGNYLYATVDAEGNTSVEGDKGDMYKYYKLTKYNNKVGFWWNAENGAPFKNGQNKAYLALKRNSNSAAVKGFTLEGLEQTGIANASTQENVTSTAVYDLNGKLMPQTQTYSLPAGVYIINGKVTILKK